MMHVCQHLAKGQSNCTPDRKHFCDNGVPCSCRAHRNPAKRHQDLRAFIAKSRRERRAKRADPAMDIDDVSVWTAPSRRGSSHCVADLEAVVAPAPAASVPDDGLAVGARRNIGQEFDEEGKAWGGDRHVLSENGSGDSKEEKDKESDGGCEDPTLPSPAFAPSLPRPFSQSEDIVVELSTLERSAVAELDEVHVYRPGSVGLVIVASAYCTARRCCFFAVDVQPRTMKILLLCAAVEHPSHLASRNPFKPVVLFVVSTREIFIVTRYLS